MKFIYITVAGTMPLLMHKFTDAAQESATAGSRSSMTTPDRGTPLEQAQSVLYTGPEGEVIMPQPCIFQTIIQGGSFFKAGRSKITTQKSSLIPACVQIPAEYLTLEYEEDWTVDSRPVRIPATGGRIMRHRPKFEDWSFTFPCQLDDDDINAKLFREIVDVAGRKVGLCDYRPATKGPFGTFVVTKWDEVKKL